MPGTLRADFLELLGARSKHGVDFILVGGVAAALQGAPIMTFDVDVLHSDDAHNLTRLLADAREEETGGDKDRASFTHLCVKSTPSSE